jgi:hypothetical protein
MSEYWFIRATRVVDRPMFLVHEQARNRSRTGIHVLVRTPRGEIHIPIVQFQRHIAGRVGQVPADEEISRMGMLCNSRNVEELSAVILDARKQDQGEFFGVLVDEREDLLRGDDMVVVRLDQDHRFLGIIAVP